MALSDHEEKVIPLLDAKLTLKSKDTQRGTLRLLPCRCQQRTVAVGGSALAAQYEGLERGWR